MLLYRIGGGISEVISYRHIAHEWCRIRNKQINYVVVQTAENEIVYGLCESAEDGITEINFASDARHDRRLDVEIN